jgi:hypothetical protein
MWLFLQPSRINAQGLSVILISHSMLQLLEITNRISNDLRLPADELFGERGCGALTVPTYRPFRAKVLLLDDTSTRCRLSRPDDIESPTSAGRDGDGQRRSEQHRNAGKRPTPVGDAGEELPRRTGRV